MPSKQPTFNSAYSRRPGRTLDTGPGLTEQAHKRQTDVNFILKDYKATGMLKHANKYEGKYDDLTGLDFQEAMYKVTQAQQMFEDLPSSIRNRFEGNPAKFLDFVQNPENKDEMAQMGILKGNDGIDIKGAATGAPVAAPESPPPGDTPPE